MYKFVTKEIKAGIDINAQHQAVLKYFPYGENVRFRVEEDRTIILCPILPKIDIKCSMQVIPEYKIGDHLSFCTKLNAIRRNSHRQKNEVVPLTKIGELIPWFKAIAESNGFEIAQFEKVIPLGKVMCCHKEKPFPINSVEFIGKLVVKDPVKFNRAVSHGIGRSKAFGYGVIDVKE